MEELRTRSISLTWVGTEGGEDEEEFFDDGDCDLMSWICVDCGYKEQAEYRGDEDGDEDEEEE